MRVSSQSRGFITYGGSNNDSMPRSRLTGSQQFENSVCCIQTKVKAMINKCNGFKLIDKYAMQSSKLARD